MRGNDQSKRQKDHVLISEVVYLTSTIFIVINISLIEQFIPTNAHRHIMSIVSFINNKINY
jgi:hypothetical protein